MRNQPYSPTVSKEIIDSTQQRTNGNVFFLQNGSFFSTNVAPGSQFSVTAPAQAPNIDFFNAFLKL